MDSFYLKEDGVWYQPPSNSKGEMPAPIWVCSPLKILAITRDQDSENHGKLLQFFDYDRKEHRWSMPLELLAGDGTAYRQILLSGGLKIKEGKQGRELLSKYIQSADPQTRMRCVNRLGWFNNVYILPQHTIGQISGEEEIVFQAQIPIADHHHQKGTLDEWKQNIAKFCVDNSRLSFSVSIGFAAPLLPLLGEENGGFNLRSPSS